jgi:molecular chaperone DnaK
MVAARLDPQAIGDVLCVGGSTRIPLVRERLAELFGREPNMSIHPDEVVAQGAAIQAGSLSGKLALGTGMGERSALPSVGLSPLFNDGVHRHYDPGQPLPRPLLLDVTPATLSIATAGGYTERLLEKNAPIPIERTKVFTTARDHQSRVVIDCCRGEAKKFVDNEPIGHLVLDELPPRPRGQVRIEVTFRVDTDGILHVRARDADTGAKQEAQLAVIGAPVREVA